MVLKPTSASTTTAALMPLLEHMFYYLGKGFGVHAGAADWRELTNARNCRAGPPFHAVRNGKSRQYAPLVPVDSQPRLAPWAPLGSAASPGRQLAHRLADGQPPSNHVVRRHGVVTARSPWPSTRVLYGLMAGV
jgi:hypothetical protein